MTDQKKRFVGAAIEAANRAEATALLIRCGYRVYRPEADIEGEDLVLRTPWRAEKPAGELIGVQLKSRFYVDQRRYYGRDLHMLFPSGTYSPNMEREWFLAPHDALYDWIEPRKRHTPKWAQFWHTPKMDLDLQAFVAGWRIVPLAQGHHDKFGLFGMPAVVSGEGYDS